MNINITKSYALLNNEKKLLFALFEIQMCTPLQLFDNNSGLPSCLDHVLLALKYSIQCVTTSPPQLLLTQEVIAIILVV